MNETRPKIRLFVDGDLTEGGECALAAAQAHYLRNVMRRDAGDEVAVFNGRHGEWRATVTELSRKAGRLALSRQLREQSAEPDLWLLFAPIKRQAVDFMVQKATELGVSTLQPVLTRYTNAGRVNLERLHAVALEAAEQCERLNVPEVREAMSLERALDDWPEERLLFHCDEAGGAPAAAESMAAATGGPAAVLIGPVGGFDEGERAGLAERPFVRPVSLGPRILRADTAALAALAIWQATVGDWRD